MQCYIYRSSIKDGLYVYLTEEDGLERLPEPVLKQMGAPEFAMTIELDADKNLAQENVSTVLENLATQGFHVQMPKDIEDQLASIAQAAAVKRKTP